MSRLTRAFALIGVVTGVLALGRPDVARAGPKLSELERTFWKLDHIDDVPTEQDSVIVQISKGEIVFSAPCGARRYPFSYDESGFVRFHPAWSTTGDTRCAAGPAWGKIEPPLARVKRHALNDDALTLLDKNGRPIIVLSRIAATGLENQKWSIAEYWDGKALISAEHDAYIVFLHGRIDGTPGCGAFWADYSLSAQSLKLRISVILAGWCLRSANAQGGGVVAALHGDLLVEYGPLRTVLRDSQGTARIVLKPYRLPSSRQKLPLTRPRPE